jgi:hypothetical protein
MPQHQDFRLSAGLLSDRQHRKSLQGDVKMERLLEILDGLIQDGVDPNDIMVDSDDLYITKDEGDDETDDAEESDGEEDE